MLKETRKSILEIDAFLTKSTLGYIVVDDKIELSSSYKIKIVNGRDYIDVTYDQLINTECDQGWPLFAGKDALIKDR